VIEKTDGSFDFKGEARDIPPQILPDGVYQEDSGGDRFLRGAWRRRRGMLHTDVAKTTNPIVSILGFELPGEDFALAYAEGENLHGNLNVIEQTYGGGGSGWGDTEFGENFGE
jgi:hypothetical protein